MIRKLRIRITAVIMIGLTILITAVASGIYIFMQRSETEETDRAIDSAVNSVMRDEMPHEDKDTKPKPPDGFDPFMQGFPGFSDPRREPGIIPASRSWISVLVTPEGGTDEVVYSSPFSKPENEDEISSAASGIAAGNSENGYIVISGVSYKYQIKHSGGKTRVIFIDRTNQLATMRRLLIVLVIVGISALIVLFPISIMVSGWIVRPIERTWNDQKEFFANASHELKTPLTVISANIDVIMSDPDKTVSEQGKWFEYIKSEAVKMSKLINQMLYLSKNDRAESEMLITDVAVSEAVEGACLAAEALAFEKGHELVTDIEPDITCMGDREMIVRLANILLDNAISHSADGSAVNVDLHRKKGRNVLTVTNIGEYIPPEELSRLFDRFYRTDRSRTGETGGFGLGLSIAKTIAENHKGTLTASSSPDGTTSFTFTWNHP